MNYLTNIPEMIRRFLLEYPEYYVAYDSEYDDDSSSDYETESDVDSEDYDSVDSDE